MEAWMNNLSGRVRWLDPSDEDLTDWTQISLPSGVEGTLITSADVTEFLATHSLDGTAYVSDLSQIKQAKWQEILVARTEAENGGCMTPLGRVDTTPSSRNKITGAVQMATLSQMGGQPFSMSWTMEDNSDIEHDGPQMMALGIAVGQHVSLCHSVGRTKRDALELATTVTEIDALTADSGWPS